MSRRTTGIFVGVLAVAGFLRLWGFTWGLPDARKFTPLYVDEYTYLQMLKQTDPRHLKLHPTHLIDPTFFYYQFGAALGAASALHLVTLKNDQNYYLEHRDAYRRLFIVGRTVVLFYGLALVVLFYFLGREITGSENGGLLTMMFYAIVPIAVLSCHVVDIGAPVSFWLAVSFWSVLRGLRDRSDRWLYAAAVTAGLAFTTKYTAAPWTVPLAWAFIRYGSGVGVWLKGAGLFVLAFLLGTPYCVIDPAFFFGQFGNAFHQGTQTSPHADWHNLLMPLRDAGLSLGWGITLSACAGLVWAGVRRNQAAFLACLYIVPYFFLLAASPLHVDRYMNEALPFLLPFAALLVMQARALGVLIGLWGVSVLPYTLALDRSLACEIDPRDQASDWIVQHLPADTSIGLEHEAQFMLPGHLYMQYWKGSRYSAAEVPGPDYRLTVWDDVHRRWPNETPRYWVNTHFYFADFTKNPAQQMSNDRNADAMQQGSHPFMTFKRDIHWGPFRYRFPIHPGIDWRIFWPEITLYETDPATR